MHRITRRISPFSFRILAFYVANMCVFENSSADCVSFQSNFWASSKSEHFFLLFFIVIGCVHPDLSRTEQNNGKMNVSNCEKLICDESTYHVANSFTEFVRENSQRAISRNFKTRRAFVTFVFALYFCFFLFLSERETRYENQV